MSIVKEKYKVNHNIDFASDLSDILSNYNLDFEIDELNIRINKIYSMLLQDDVYTLKKLFEDYSPWTVRLMVEQGVLEGKLLSIGECRQLSATYFLNSEEATKKKVETLKSEEMREFFRKDTQSRWDDTTGKYDEWKKKVMKGLLKAAKNPERIKEFSNYLKKEWTKPEYRKKKAMDVGVKDYYEFMVNTINSPEWQNYDGRKKNSASFFSLCLEKLKPLFLSGELDLGFLAAKTNKEKESEYLESVVAGNFVYLNHILFGLENNKILVKVSRYIKEKNIDLGFYLKSTNGYSGLKKLFDINGRAGKFHRNETFHRYYYAVLIACDLYNQGVRKKDLRKMDDSLFNLLRSKSYDLLFSAICVYPNDEVASKRFRRIHRRFLDAYVKFKKGKGFISEVIA